MIGAYSTFAVQKLFLQHLARSGRLVPGGVRSGGIRGLHGDRHGARAHGDSLPLRPPARNAARDLGYLAGPDPDRAADVRRAERHRRQPELARRRDRGPARFRAHVQPIGGDCFQLGGDRLRLVDSSTNLARASRARGHPKSRGGRRHGHPDPQRGSLDVRRRLGRRGTRRRGAFPARQRRARARTAVHRRLVHGRGAGRRRQTGGHVGRRARPRAS